MPKTMNKADEKLTAKEILSGEKNQTSRKSFTIQGFVDVRSIATIDRYLVENNLGEATSLSNLLRMIIEGFESFILNSKPEVRFTDIEESLEYLQARGFSLSQFNRGRQAKKLGKILSMIEQNKEGFVSALRSTKTILTGSAQETIQTIKDRKLLEEIQEIETLSDLKTKAIRLGAPEELTSEIELWDSKFEEQFSKDPSLRTNQNVKIAYAGRLGSLEAKLANWISQEKTKLGKLSEPNEPNEPQTISKESPNYQDLLAKANEQSRLAEEEVTKLKESTLAMMKERNQLIETEKDS